MYVADGTVVCACGLSFAGRRGLTQHQNQSRRCLYIAAPLVPAGNVSLRFGGDDNARHDHANEYSVVDIGGMPNEDIPAEEIHDEVLGEDVDDVSVVSGDDEDQYLEGNSTYNFNLLLQDAREMLDLPDEYDAESETEPGLEDKVGIEAETADGLSVFGLELEKQLHGLFPNEYGKRSFDISEKTTTKFECGKIFVGASLDRSVSFPFVPRGLSAGVDLMQRLRSEKIPLNMYDKIVAWLQCNYPEVDPPPTQHSIMKTVRKMFPELPKAHTEHIEIVIGKGSHKVVETLPVVWFDCWPQIYSILNDPHCMQESNMVNDPADPYGRYVPKKLVEDLQDGRDYQTWVKKHFDDDGKLCFMRILYIARKNPSLKESCAVVSLVLYVCVCDTHTHNGE